MKNNTINKKEIEKFSKIAEEWWDPSGKFAPLHKINPLRANYVSEKIDLKLTAFTYLSHNPEKLQTHMRL